MLSPGPFELVIIGCIAILLFGKRLPEVARSVGASYNEFRKGLQDIQSEMNSAIDSEPNAPSSSDQYSYTEDDYDEPTAPKFTPSNDQKPNVS